MSTTSYQNLDVRPLNPKIFHSKCYKMHKIIKLKKCLAFLLNVTANTTVIRPINYLTVSALLI